MFKLTFKLSALALASALVACGGGGGGSSSAPIAPDTPVVVAPVTPAPVVSNLVTSVPAATYASTSEELTAFNMLNDERDSCGFGKLTQNTALDTAAQDHADWMLANKVYGHNETSGTFGFTGVLPVDRATAAGYGATGAYTTGELLNTVDADKANRATRFVAGLLVAPYHMLNAVRGYRDVGVAVRDLFDIGVSPNNLSHLVMEFGYKAAVGAQVPNAGTVRTYPCEGTVGVPTALYGEIPSPVPSRDLLANPLGSSIGVVSDVGTTLKITSASMVKVSTGAVVALRAPSSVSTDPNPSELKANEGYITAEAPLDLNSKYQVVVTGTSDGVAFSRNFIFTTRSF